MDGQMDAGSDTVNGCARSLHSRPDRRAARHHAGGDGAASGGGSWPARAAKHALVLPRQARADFLKKTGHAAEQDRPDVYERRLSWFEHQPDLDPERLVFIDESGVSTKMARLYGRSPKGERCRAPIPHGHWKTITFTAGLRLNGIAAPALVDGAMNGETFVTCVSGMLVRELKPGDIVVMDNLPAHKVAGVREAIEAVGASLLYLPPYSPDFNPIEKAFSKLKALLRKAAARTVDDLYQAVADAIDAFTPAECANYFAACGYDLD